MTAEDFTRCWDALPEEVRKCILAELSPARDYLARAHKVREELGTRFPNMNAKVRAVLSLAAARIL